MMCCTDTHTRIDVCISRAPFRTKNEDVNINLSAAVNIFFKNTLTPLRAILYILSLNIIDLKEGLFSFSLHVHNGISSLGTVIMSSDTHCLLNKIDKICF